MKPDIRGITPEGKETIRDKVVLYLIQRFDRGNVTEPVYFDPDDPGKGYLFDFSRRGTLEDITRQMTPGLAIEEADASEPVPNYWPFVDVTFRVIMNFKVIKQTGVDVSSLLNYYLGRIEQELVRPEVDGLHLADLTLSVVSAGNSMQYNGDTDPEPGAAAMFDITIRHVQGDPFSTEYPNG